MTDPTWVSMFCRAEKTPKLARKTDLPLPVTSQAMPTRGCHMFVWLGIVPSLGNAGSSRNAAYAVVAGSTVSGMICASQRRP